MHEFLLRADQVLKDHDYTVLYIGYYGAHNYNLADEKSDYDFKAVVLPNLRQCIKRESISTVIENEWGNIDVKDLMTFANVVNKGNFSYIETLNTPYFIDYGLNGLEHNPIRSIFADAQVNYMSMVGGIYEKFKAFSHQYPSKRAEFALYGCDPKQFMAAVRLYECLKFHAKYPDINVPFLKYANDDVIDLSEFYKLHGFPSSRKYIFTREEFIQMKRKLIMDIAETQWIFENISDTAKSLLPKDYKFVPNNYTDLITDLLVDYYTFC